MQLYIFLALAKYVSIFFIIVLKILNLIDSNNIHI